MLDLELEFTGLKAKLKELQDRLTDFRGYL